MAPLTWSDTSPAPEKLLGALMLAASASVGAWAQEAGDASSPTLSTVTVRENVQVQAKDTLKVEKTRIGKGEQELRDIPQTVTVFTERLMTDRNQDDLRDVLRSTAGVTFQAGETGEEDVRMRGFSLLQAGDLYIDGMRDAPLYERDTFNDDRVEVLKGSASMLFGKGSTGGVVNQVSKMPMLMEQKEVSYTFGTGREHRLTGDFNIQTGKNAALRLNALLHNEYNSGAFKKKRGIAPTYSWGIGSADEFSIGAYYLEVHGRPLYNHPWFLSSKGTIIPTLPARNYYGLASDYLDTSAQYVTFSHTHRFEDEGFNADGTLQTRLRHGRYERDLWASALRFAPGTTLANLNPDTVLIRTPKGRVGISELTQLQSDYSRNFSWFGKNNAVLAGLDYYYDDARRNQNFAGPASGLSTTVGTPNDGAWRPDTRGNPVFNTYAVHDLGLYIQDTLELTGAFKLVAGLRYDHFSASYRSLSGKISNERNDNLFSPRLGLLYQPSPVASYYVSYGTSYNTSGDAYQYDVNPSANTGKTANTGPEKSRNFEIGGKFDLFARRASLGVALFYSEKYNERNTDPDVAAEQQLLSGKRHAAGMEFNLAGRVTPKWEVFFNHTWIPDAKIDKSNQVLAANGGGAQVQGDRPALTPRHSGSVWTTYTLTPELRLGGGLNYRGRQNPEGARNVTAPGFATIDAMLEYTIDEKNSLKLNVSNLANKLYADTLYRGFYAPGAARAAQLTFKSRF